MSVEITRLDAGHNSELLALAALTDTGNSAFRVDRSPDFFALARALGTAEYFGAFDQGQLVGCAALTGQLRDIGGQPRQTFYINDVRTDPRCHLRPGVVRRLIESVVQAGRERGEWAFAVVMDASTHRRGLQGRRGRLFPAGRALGSTVHLGVPTEEALTSGAQGVVELADSTAWQAFRSLAGGRDFALADRDLFFACTGWSLGIREEGGIAAVCRLTDQTSVRRILVQGEPLPHVYLSYYAARPGTEARGRFLGYGAKILSGTCRYFFMPLALEEEARYARPEFPVIRSTTFVYGDTPPGLSLAFRELTLI
jgi:hypothetical protein